MIFIGIIVGIFALEFYLKNYVNEHRLQGSREEIMNGRIILKNYHNHDSAFGWIKNFGKNATLVSTVILIGIAWDFTKMLFRKGHALGKLGLSLVLGGGLSNFYDRKKQGYVTDYFSLGVKNKKIRGTVFNLSDFFIFAGVTYGAFLV